jgi:hypothetical protein
MPGGDVFGETNERLGVLAKEVPTRRRQVREW